MKIPSICKYAGTFRFVGRPARIVGPGIALKSSCARLDFLDKGFAVQLRYQSPEFSGLETVGGSAPTGPEQSYQFK